MSVTRLLEVQRHMMEVQVQAMAAQSVTPLRKFTGESINTDEGNIDRWVEQFEERARVMGWDEGQKLFQLKAHLEKMAEHTVHMLTLEEKTSYTKVVVAQQKRFRSLDIEELCGLEFHQLMQDRQSVEELGMELQRLGRKAFPTSEMKEFDRILKGRFYQALLPKWQKYLGLQRLQRRLKSCTLEHVPWSDMINSIMLAVENQNSLPRRILSHLHPRRLMLTPRRSHLALSNNQRKALVLDEPVEDTLASEGF